MGLKDKLNAALIKARNSKQAKKNPIGTLKTKAVQEIPTKLITPEREKPKGGKSFPGQQYPNSTSGYSKSMEALMSGEYASPSEVNDMLAQRKAALSMDQKRINLVKTRKKS